MMMKAQQFLRPHRFAVLAYHRVIDLPSDPQLLAVTPECFRKQIRLLKKHFDVISLETLANNVFSQFVPQKPQLAITFDDGYFDNADIALPILEALDAPATFFVVSSAIDSNCEFWWDELERLVLTEGNFPSKVSFPIGGQFVEFDLTGEEHWTESIAKKYANWDVTQKGNPTARHKMYRTLHKLIKPLAPLERKAALKELQRFKDDCCRPTHRPMTAAQLKTLCQSTVARVGGHTLNHPQLSSLNPSAQGEEISEGKRQLEQLCGTKINTFAYPYGGAYDFDENSQFILKDLDVKFACAAYPGRFHSQTNRLAIPRFTVRNWKPLRFQWELFKYLRWS